MSSPTPLKLRLGALFAVFCLFAAVVPSTALAAAPSSAPTGLSPTVSDTVNGNPVFRWNAVTGAAKYRIQVSTVSNFSTVTYAVDTVERVATATTDLPLGTLYWRVAGMDASNNAGPWADTQFTKQWGAAPSPSYPNDGATLTFPTDALRFTWSALPGAQSYELQVDDASDFVGATTYTTKNTSYVITEPKTSGQSFYWHVRGISSTNGVASNWSDARQATVNWPGKPTLLYPPDNSQIDAGQVVASCPTATVLGNPMGCDLYFEWSAVMGAKTYQLQVSPNADWANNRSIDIVVKGTRYAPPTMLNNGNYYWRVRALDAAQTPNNGTWSDVGLIIDRVFQRSWTSRPILQTPSNHNNAVSVPTFTWTPIDHASYYELQVSTDVNFGSGNQSCFTNRTTWTPGGGGIGVNLVNPDGCGIGLIPGDTYYWHVRGIDAPVLNPGLNYPKGVVGLWSNTSNLDVWNFTYFPSMPAYVSPADGATVTVPTLKWADAPGSVRYHVVIRKSNGQSVATTDTYSTSWTPTTALNVSDGPFSWYVQSIDLNGQKGIIPGDPWTFSLTAITPSASTPELVTPADGGSSVDMPSMSWQAVIGAAKYQVWYRVLGSLIWQPLNVSPTAYPAYTYEADVFSAGTYEWIVQALNAGGGDVSDTLVSRTFTIAQLNLVAPEDYLTPTRCATPPACTPYPDTPTLTWDPVDGATWYEVTVSLDPHFTNDYRVYDTPYTILSPRDSWLDNQANQAYYWFVRPNRGSNNGRMDDAALQNASAFQKRSEGIHLYEPSDGESIKDEITFSWEDFLVSNKNLGVPGVTQEAKQYHIQVSTVQDFATVLDDKIVDETFFTEFDRTYPEGPLFWRVQAIDASNNALTWSAVVPIVLRPRTVTKASDPVSRTYPAANATVTGVPYFQWTPQAFAATYDIEIAKSGDTNFSSTNRVILQNTKMSAFAYGEALAAGDYAWRVRRVDADGRAGPWSCDDLLHCNLTGRVFHLVPGAPALVAPTNGSSVTSMATFVFSWSPTPAYPKYVLETSAASNFGTLIENRTTAMTSWAPTTAYTNGTYYWHVKALNAAGVVVATSSTWHFTLMPPPTTGRWYGPDRYATAASISSHTFSPGVSYAFIAIGTNYPDALAGAAAAGYKHSPVLLVPATLPLPAVVTTELTRLKPQKIVVLGSSGVIPNATMTALQPYMTGPGTVQRWWGWVKQSNGAVVSDRYMTAAAISANTFPTGVPYAFIAVGNTPYDALSGAAAAGHLGGPVLLVPPVGSSPAIPPSVVTELQRLKPTQIVVLGNTSAVSASTMTALGAYSTKVPVRWYQYNGSTTSNQYITALSISKNTYTNPSSPRVAYAFIAIGTNWPDALAGAAAGGQLGGPILFIPTTNGVAYLPLQSELVTELQRLKPQHIVVLGSAGIIPDTVKNAFDKYIVP